MIENEVNKLAEWNLLHDIINPFRTTKFKTANTLLLYMDV